MDDSVEDGTPSDREESGEVAIEDLEEAMEQLTEAIEGYSEGADRFFMHSEYMTVHRVRLTDGMRFVCGRYRGAQYVPLEITASELDSFPLCEQCDF